MSRLQFSTAVTTVKDITNVTSKDDLVKRSIQMALDRITSFWNWSYLTDESFITTVAPYTTGTVDVTNASKTVTGNSTVFSTAMAGRKIRINSEEAYYRIATRDSDTQLTLEVPYQGDTATAQSYSLYQDEYRLMPDCDNYKIMRQIENGVALTGLQPSAFDLLVPTPNNESTPNFEIFAGTRIDTYTTGTVSANANTSVITGASSPAWTTVQGLGRGSRIVIGSNVYTVKSVDSDTQITVYETIASAIASGTSYEILLDNLIIQFYEIPDDDENIYYRYQRIPAPLVNDKDIPDLPDNWHWLLVEGALSWVWKVKDKDEADRLELRFRTGLADMKRRVGYLSVHQVYPKRTIGEPQLPIGPRPPSEYSSPFSL